MTIIGSSKCIMYRHLYAYIQHTKSLTVRKKIFKKSVRQMISNNNQITEVFSPQKVVPY